MNSKATTKNHKVNIWTTLTATEMVAALATVIAFGLAISWLFDQVASPVVLHNAATQFAGDLRNIEIEAKDRNQFLSIKVTPSQPGRPSLINVTGPYGVILQKAMPEDVSATGYMKIDAQGLPRCPATYILRKGRRKMTVEVDSRGGVFVPLAGDEP